ncbi:MAG: hypothetical protein IJJ29_05645 [Solobacterium sp.]|nr:hypothetical protein [Solobacterium sp.]
MKPEIKRILSAIMIAGDVLIMFFAIEEMLTGWFGFGLFLTLFLLADAYLSLDYIRSQTQIIKMNEQLRIENAQVRYKRLLEEERKQDREDLSEYEPEEVAELLNQKRPQSSRKQY